MFWLKHANTRKQVSEQSWLSDWIILIVLDHLAHFAQSYFSLIFSAINKYNCSWFDLIHKKICSDWRQKLGEKRPMLTTFCVPKAKIKGLIKSVRKSFNWWYINLFFLIFQVLSILGPAPILAIWIWKWKLPHPHISGIMHLRKHWKAQEKAGNQQKLNGQL